MLTPIRSRLRPDLPSGFEHEFRSLRRGIAALDCGANVGRFTEMMAACGATVYAFEPHPLAAEALRARFSRWANVEVIEAAVGVERGRARLHLHVDHADDELKWSTGSSLFPAKENVLRDEYVDVEVVDLDAFLACLPQPVGLVKMDIEGAEVPVLLKLIDSGRLERIPHVLVELHRVPGQEAERARLERLLGRHPNVRTDWT